MCVCVEASISPYDVAAGLVTVPITRRDRGRASVRRRPVRVFVRGRGLGGTYVRTRALFPRYYGRARFTYRRPIDTR